MQISRSSATANTLLFRSVKTTILRSQTLPIYLIELLQAQCCLRNHLLYVHINLLRMN